MHICDIFSKNKITFSYEFFPPKTDEAWGQLFGTIADLEKLHPAFVSVTYGAGGSTRQKTHDLVVRIKRETACDPVPHLTSICHTDAEIGDILRLYAAAGISNIMALAGDPPHDRPNYDRSKDAFRYAAELVRFIRTIPHSDPRGFGVGVAGFPEGHPATPNRLKELDYLKAKIDAGADYIVTQLFFDNHDFLDFRERCEIAGITVPMVAGIMPITSLKGMDRMAELALGSRFPARLLKALARCDGDEKYARRVGVQWATEQCRDLIDSGVRGIHFYTLNRSTATQEIFANLGLKDSRQLKG